MAVDFTCILRDEFKRFIEQLPYEELRHSIFTEELEVADRLLAPSETICREFVFFLRIFVSRNCDISEDITELIKQLFKLYEGLTGRYRERVSFDVHPNPSTKAMPGEEEGRGLAFLSRKSKD